MNIRINIDRSNDVFFVISPHKVFPINSTSGTCRESLLSHIHVINFMCAHRNDRRCNDAGMCNNYDFYLFYTIRKDKTGV
jgi:hypothetical protein